MNSNARIEALLHQPDDVFYVETSIAPGLTLSEYRRTRPRPTRWQRLKQLAGGPQMAAARP